MKLSESPEAMEAAYQWLFDEKALKMLAATPPVREEMARDLLTAIEPYADREASELRGIIRDLRESFQIEREQLAEPFTREEPCEGPRCGGSGEFEALDDCLAAEHRTEPCDGCPDCREEPCDGSGIVSGSGNPYDEDPIVECLGCPNCQPDCTRPQAEETVLQKLMERVERDRREPDKLLCHLASARSELLRQPQAEELVEALEQACDHSTELEDLAALIRPGGPQPDYEAVANSLERIASALAALDHLAAQEER